MLLYLPESFDENEWFIVVTILLNILIFLFLPKRFPPYFTPLIVLLSMSYPKIMDHTMAVKPFNWYDLTDSPKYELFDLMLYATFPAFGYLFVYLLDVYKPKGLLLVLYFIGWSIFSLVFELITVKLHVFVYTGWKLIYSFPVYICVLSMTYLFYRLLLLYQERNSKTTS